MNFDWADLAFGSKKPLKELKATFIVAPREISPIRFTQIVKEYLPKGNIVVGLAKEPYIVGFEGQPQFKTLKQKDIASVIEKVNTSKSPNKIYVLQYAQNDLKHIFEKISFRHVLLVNGSWKYSFHTQAPFYTLIQSGAPYSFVSAFCDEAEAKAYEKQTNKLITHPEATAGKAYTEVQLLNITEQAAKYSYDYAFQTGVSLAKQKGKKYQFLAWAFNKVVPYQTYAMLHGASRETNYSPPNDLNHYDTVHAETMLVIKAATHNIDLTNTTLFINLLPCPACARMLSETPIAEVVYTEDHSDGYAVKLLEQSGKIVRRLVT